MNNFGFLAAASLVVIAAPAAAQSMQQGTYVNDDNSAKFVFGESSGSFIQYKSINGNPGTITIDFDYNLVGNTLTMSQKRISLTDHPMARSAPASKVDVEQVEIRSNAVVIGGIIYKRQ
ncbi:MAG: hypothetical protein ACR2O7_01380 [Parasphingorhabdus sp.]